MIYPWALLFFGAIVSTAANSEDGGRPLPLDGPAPLYDETVQALASAGLGQEPAREDARA